MGETQYEMFSVEDPGYISKGRLKKTSTKFVQKLRELNKAKHIQKNFEFLNISKNIFKLFYISLFTIYNVNGLHLYK